MNQDWLKRWKCFHFHNHVSRMEGGSWEGLRCTTPDCGDLFSAAQYRLFSENMDGGEPEPKMKVDIIFVIGSEASLEHKLHYKPSPINGHSLPGHAL